MPPARSVRALRRGLLPLLRFVLPAPCFACGRPAVDRPYLGACLACWAALRPVGPRACPGCGRLRPAGSDALGPPETRCGDCLQQPPPPFEIRTAVLYRGAARRFLLRAKAGRPELLAPLGDQLARVLSGERFADDRSCVCFVPAHPLRRLQRGYNPARLLARRVASSLGLPLRLRATIHGLGHLRPSKSLGAAERLFAGPARFKPLLGAPGERVLLIDDVLTTGGTARDCAGALLRSGARSVRIAVWARTPPPFDRDSGRLL